MMSCREVCEKAQDFTDGTVGPLTRAKIRLHLLMCRNCSGFVDQTRQTSTLISTSLRPRKDTKVDPDLMAAFRKKEK